MDHELLGKLQRECTMRRDMHVEACKKIDERDAIIANVRALLTKGPVGQGMLAYRAASVANEEWRNAIRKALGE